MGNNINPVGIVVTDNWRAYAVAIINLANIEIFWGEGGKYTRFFEMLKTNKLY